MSNSVLCVVCKVFVFKFLDSSVYCVNPLDYCEMILLPVTSLAKYVFFFPHINQFPTLRILTGSLTNQLISDTSHPGLALTPQVKSSVLQD